MPDPTTKPSTAETPEYEPCPAWCQLTDCRATHFADVSSTEVDNGAAIIGAAVFQQSPWREWPGKPAEVHIEAQGDLGEPAPCMQPCCLGDNPPYGIHPSADLRLSIEQASELAKLLTTLGGTEWLIESLNAAVATLGGTEDEPKAGALRAIYV